MTEYKNEHRAFIAGNKISNFTECKQSLQGNLFTNCYCVYSASSEIRQQDALIRWDHAFVITLFGRQILRIGYTTDMHVNITLPQQHLFDVRLSRPRIGLSNEDYVLYPTQTAH